MATNRRGAGENQMIEWQFGKSFADFGAAGDERQFGLVEQRGRKLRHQRRRRGCELRRLDHGAVARGENIRKRGKGQIDREIPRRNDTDNPLGLKLHPRLRTKQAKREVEFALFRLHPGIDMLQGMGKRTDSRHDVGKHRLFGGPVAEVVAKCPR